MKPMVHYARKKNVPIVDLETSRNVSLEECIGKSMERVCCVEQEGGGRTIEQQT